MLYNLKITYILYLYYYNYILCLCIIFTLYYL